MNKNDLTPEGAAVAAEMKRQEGTYWQARRWNHNAIATAAIEASEEIKALRVENARLHVVKQHWRDTAQENTRLRALLEALTK